MDLDDLEFKAADFLRSPPDYPAEDTLGWAARVANEVLLERLQEKREWMFEELVNRFLAWPLPKSVRPDPCVMDQGYPHRSGTNLLTADEARQMFQHCIEELGEE